MQEVFLLAINQKIEYDCKGKIKSITDKNQNYKISR